MDKWVVRKKETADAIIEAMELGICQTNESVKIIAEAMGDTVRWRTEGVDTPPPATAMPFVFPVTEEDFLDYQEKLTGRELTADERETIAAWVPVINSAYADGLSNSIMDELDGFITQNQEEYPVAMFLEKAKLWMKFAAAQRLA